MARLAEAETTLARLVGAGCESAAAVGAARRRRHWAAAAALSQLPTHGEWWRGEPVRRLWAAAAAGDAAIVRQLIQGGVPVDARRPTDGRSAVMLAARGGHVAAMSALIDAGAQLEEGCDRGRTPMHYACRAADKAMAAGGRRGAAGSAAVAGYGVGDPMVDAGAAVLLAVNGASLDVPDAAGVAPLDGIRPECSAALGKEMAVALAATAERMAGAVEREEHTASLSALL